MSSGEALDLGGVALVAHYCRKSGSQAEVQARGFVPNPA
jgi:hypothetical protein